jgi:hypothetical protein
MNNQLKNIMLVMVVAVSVPSAVRAECTNDTTCYLKAAYTIALDAAKAVTHAAVVAKDGIVDAGKATLHAICNPVATATNAKNVVANAGEVVVNGTVAAGKATAHAVCNPVATVTAAKDSAVKAGEVVVHAVCNPTETATHVVTTIAENPKTTAAVVAGAVLAYIAYTRCNSNYEEAQNA